MSGQIILNVTEETLRWNMLALQRSRELRELSIKAVAAMDARKNENVLEWAKELVRDIVGAKD